MTETVPEEPLEPDVPLEGPEHEPTPDEGEDPPEDPGEPEQPAEEPAGEPESAALMEEIGRKLDSLQKTVATRMSSILGEHALDFEECDLCSYWNVPGWRMKGHLPEDLRAELAALIGQRIPGTLKEDRHSHACPDCGGEGEVKTGSNVPGQDKLPCVECEGMGWQPTDDARRRGRMSLTNGVTAQALGVTPQDAAMQPAPLEEDPEVARLRSAGYVVVPPMV